MSSPEGEGNEEKKTEGSPKDGSGQKSPPASLQQSETPYKTPTSPTPTGSQSQSPKSQKAPEVQEGLSRAESKDGLESLNSDMITQLKEADKRAVETAQLIQKMRESILKISQKSQITDEDNEKLKRKQNELMEKLTDFEEATKKIEQLIGMGEVTTSELSSLVKSSMKSEKLDTDSTKKEKKKVTLASDSFDNFTEDHLPKVIVCGVGNSDQVPKIIICETAKIQGCDDNSGRPVFQQYRGRNNSSMPYSEPQRPLNQYYNPPTMGNMYPEMWRQQPPNMTMPQRQYLASNNMNQLNLYNTQQPTYNPQNRYC